MHDHWIILTIILNKSNKKKGNMIIPQFCVLTLNKTSKSKLIKIKRLEHPPSFERYYRKKNPINLKLILPKNKIINIGLDQSFSGLHNPLNS